jgi:hypothetical protein
MNAFTLLRILTNAILAGLIACSLILASSNTGSLADKPPEGLQGGAWTDDFFTEEWLKKQENTQVDTGHLQLKLLEPQHWMQTWTAHFDGGEFFHTEAISDSVRLAPDGTGHFFTRGAYTSAVFHAGKKVDWILTRWNFAGIPNSIIVEFRIGSTPNPDAGWSGWKSPGMKINEGYCSYINNSHQTECLTNMIGIASSPYIQYRATFYSDDPSKTVALNDIDLLFGLHPDSGTATSVAIAPLDLGEWQTLVITPTVTLNTTLIVDVLAADGTVLQQDVHNGDSLAWIDPKTYPALQLQAILTTQDASLSPDLDLWGLRWAVTHRLYLAVVVMH